MPRFVVRILIPALLCLVAYGVGVFVGGLTPDVDTRGAERLTGLAFTTAERDSMTEDLAEYTRSYERMRDVPLPNSVSPALVFNPLPAGFVLPSGPSTFRPTPVGVPDRPDRLERLAFASVAELSAMIHARKITSTELTKVFLERLRRYGPELQCVVTLTDSLALAQAARADAELARGIDRGSLHGIPYGAKDLLAQKDYPTTWGSVPYQAQHLDETATVIRKLEEAGAVLVAKLTLGELAWGDVWFGGMTRNPWDAAATAAGLVPFAIGSETWGSIVSPSDRCGTSGLRPTFGRVSRAGAMALSWSMDKIGPIARSAEDCAFVFRAIQGYDPLDPTTVRDVPFRFDASLPLRSIRLGFYKSAFDSVKRHKNLTDSMLVVLRSLGAELVPVEFPSDPSVNDLSHILSAEAAAAFDDLTRSNRDDLLVRQIKNAWPNVFRSARFIPAVEYLQANRVRTIVIEKMATMFRWVDVVVTPSFGGDQLLMTNLTGHPCAVVPMGFTDDGTPVSISFIGQLFDEGRLLAAASAYQEATQHHRKHPARFQGD